MRRLLPDPVVGALAGFALGFLASFNLAYLGIDVSGWPTIGFGIVVAFGGYVVGSCFQSSSGRARMVASWCVVTAVALGVVASWLGSSAPSSCILNCLKARC
jgi:hypothetical protein